MEISFQGLLEGLEGQKQQNQTYLSTLQPEQFTDHRGGRLDFFYLAIINFVIGFFSSCKSNPGIFVYNTHCVITFSYEIFCAVVFHTSIEYLELWLDEANKKY